jgi:hypothetical protein
MTRWTFVTVGLLAVVIGLSVIIHDWRLRRVAGGPSNVSPVIVSPDASLPVAPMTSPTAPPVPETDTPTREVATNAASVQPPTATPRSSRATPPQPVTIRVEPTTEPEPVREVPPRAPVVPNRVPSADQPAPEPLRAPEAPAVIPGAAPNPPPPASTRPGTELAAVQQVLDRYQQLYHQLDANAVASIWPSVDSRALAKIFSRLEHQDLTFDTCAAVISESKATAQCAGSLRYVPRVGSATVRSEHHDWTIDLERAGGTWQIVRVTAR